MATKKDPYAGLRAIAEKYGWTLHPPLERGGDYRMTKSWREIRWNRHGHGTCTVRGDGFGAIGRSHFTMLVPGLVSREAFAEAILSAYTDEKFLRAVRLSLRAYHDRAQLHLNDAMQAQAEFDAALKREGLTIEEDSDG